MKTTKSSPLTVDSRSEEILPSASQPLLENGEELIATLGDDQAISQDKVLLDQSAELENNNLENSSLENSNLENSNLENIKNGKREPASQKRSLFLIVGAIALGLSAVGGWNWWQFQKTHVSTENAQIQGHLSPISCEISATVQQVLVKDGDYVQGGQTLVVLANQDLALNLQQAKAKLRAAQAQLASAKHTVQLTSQTHITQVQQSQAQLGASQSGISVALANVEQAKAAIAVNQARVAQAQTDVEKTQADYRRYDSLYQSGAISAQQADLAKSAYSNNLANLAATNRVVEQSQAELMNAQAQLQKAIAESEVTKGQAAQTDVAEQNVVVQQDQEKLAQAQVEEAKVEIAMVEKQLEYTVIKAPVSGFVGKLTAQVGQKVQSGQSLLAVVPLQTDQIYIEANFKETSLQNLRLGQDAEVEVDAYPGEVFRATVEGISPATGASFALLPPDNATGNYNKVVQWLPVRLAFRPDADPNHKLRAGLSIKVTVDTANVSK
ncbi:MULTISPECIES: HlyD family secretion protein [Pseudanabaena]|uniref:Secretion protein HlyD family protein n=2 Tax=Pseudanabaena TaxID=1152 RepID=L8MZD8_9CYAN|nr:MULTISPECIES: HlyD family secretion protein [Pseudanabaena]ELS32164.1 secretion protein HlyD family protein [Pseudanabaena biceps PCC 7429]MDG3495600.1 HlyD family secretion protein [Pseudanabaena catenata USMAC16]